MKNILKVVFGLALLGILGACHGWEDPGQVSPQAPEKRTVVTSGPAYEANPVVSPDGQWVYFESDADGDMDLYRIPLIGGEAQQLTRNTVFDSAPSPSPDGTRIVFESELSGPRHLYILDLSNLDFAPVEVTFGDREDGSPAWSPDGRHIVFESNRDKAGGTDLYLVGPQGENLSRLTATSNGVYCRTADWSPDGSRLVYESNATGYSALFTLTVAGGKSVQLTPDTGYEGHPAWSPLGDFIAFESTRDGISQVYLVAPGGGPWTQVTVLGGYWPQWTPEAQVIVYGIFNGADANLVSVPVP